MDDIVMKQRVLFLQSFLKQGSIIKIVNVNEPKNEEFCGETAVVDFVDDFGFIFCALTRNSKKIRLNPYDFFIKIC